MLCILGINTKPQMLLDLLELASNKTLEHDPSTQARLVKLQGKTMTLHIKSLEQSLSITPYPEGLEFSHDVPEQVDVTLSATLSALIKISRDGMEDAELEAGELEIQGDPIIGQRFAQIIADLNIDWESLLAEQIGEAPAKLISVSATQAREFAKESQSQIKSVLSRLLTDDLDLVAEKSDVEPFLDDVDELRADVDRLAVRIKRIQSH